VPQGMSQEEHAEVWGKLETRLSRHTKHDEDLSRLEQEERDERHRIGQRELTLSFLKGEEVDLVAALEADDISDSWALTHREDAARRGPSHDRPDIRAFYELNLLDYSEEEIMEDDDLTYATRATLVDTRRELQEDQGNWRNTQQGQEAARRIKTAVGLPDGFVVQGMQGSMLREANEALTEFYNEVEGLPLEQRVIKAPEIADRIVIRVDARKAGDELPLAISKLESAQRELNNLPEESNQRKVAENNVARKQKVVDDLQRRIERGR